MRNRLIALLAAFVLSCAGGTSTLRLRIAADPAVGALDALLALARTGAGDASHVSSPVEWNVAGRDLVANPLVAEIEIPKDSAFAVEALLVIQGRRDGVFVATAVMQTGLDATGTIDLLLVPLAPACDADGDGFRDCTKDGCCEADENDGFADCDDSQTGATPFVDKPECRCPDGAAIGTAACDETEPEADAEIVEPGETVVLPDPGSGEAEKDVTDVSLVDGHEAIDVEPEPLDGKMDEGMVADATEASDVADGPDAKDSVDVPLSDIAVESDGTDACKPDCVDKECGDDGCGGTCGACGAGHTCLLRACACAPTCDGKDCGDDGCGGSCGVCATGDTCQPNGTCLLTWRDSASNLVWQRGWGGKKPMGTGKTYCQSNQAGLPGGGWHLPNISELRSLIRGCPATEEPGGSCNVGAGVGDCLAWGCRAASCDGCPKNQGPAGGCYWDVNLQGQCTSYWSSSGVKDYEVYGWGVTFEDGSIPMITGIYSFGVRCVRSGP